MDSSFFFWPEKKVHALANPNAHVYKTHAHTHVRDRAVSILIGLVSMIVGLLSTVASIVKYQTKRLLVRPRGGFDLLASSSWVREQSAAAAT